MNERFDSLEIYFSVDHDPAKYGLTFLGESAYDLEATVNRYAALAIRRILDAFPGAKVSMVIQNTVGWLPPVRVCGNEADDGRVKREVEGILDRLASEYDTYVVMRGGQEGEYVQDYVSG
ncbi:MAG: hypothetical protein ACOYI6_11720 [Christensenellales bacterium]|jgi:hypothetical protein